MMKIGKKASDAITEDVFPIYVGKMRFSCKHCTVEQIIRISALTVSSGVELDPKGDMFTQIFRNACECDFINDIMATMIIRKTWFFPNLRRRLLAKYYGSVKRPTEMYNDFKMLIGTEEIPNFFGLITFLTEINIVGPTRKVKKTTAPGL